MELREALRLYSVRLMADETYKPRGGHPPPPEGNVTKAQRDAIAEPTIGMTVFQTDNTPGLRTWNGTAWMRYTETAD